MNDLPLNLDQETLVAYVDKELPPAQAAAVEAALMQNAAARDTVRQLRLSAAAAHAYDAALNEPVPDRLLLTAGIGGGPAASRRSRWSRIRRSWPQSIRPTWRATTSRGSCPRRPVICREDKNLLRPALDRYRQF